MSFFIDTASNSINKYGEELCGDHIEISKSDNEIIAVLSDGLGSGVKANILATLTSKIANTMLKNGADLEETVDTITNTLPECQVRKLAYSTFTIIKIDKGLNLYAIEYDNPPLFIYRKSYLMPLDKIERNINGKKIFETRMKLQLGDVISVVSDGAIHAGVGALLNLGWQWNDISKYLMDLTSLEKTSKSISDKFIDVCNNLYDHRPGDDTTILTLKVRSPEYVDLFTGPPEDKDMDYWIINKLEKASGKKVICGGTTANIACRELRRELDVDLDTMTKDVPPLAYLKGYDLVTEGVLTLQKTLENVKNLATGSLEQDFLKSNDAASRLTNLLMEDCTHLNMWVGQAVNPAHQNPDFPINMNIKLNIVNELTNQLKSFGKTVNIKYI